VLTVAFDSASARPGPLSHVLIALAKLLRESKFDSRPDLQRWTYNRVYTLLELQNLFVELEWHVYASPDDGLLAMAQQCGEPTLPGETHGPDDANSLLSEHFIQHACPGLRAVLLILTTQRSGTCLLLSVNYYVEYMLA
jgi:hypothetical protein